MEWGGERWQQRKWAPLQNQELQQREQSEKEGEECVAAVVLGPVSLSVFGGLET